MAEKERKKKIIESEMSAVVHISFNTLFFDCE